MLGEMSPDRGREREPGDGSDAVRHGTDDRLDPRSTLGVVRRLLRAEDAESVATVTVEAVHDRFARDALVWVREGDVRRLCVLATSDDVEVSTRTTTDGGGPWRALDEGHPTTVAESSWFDDDGALFLPLGEVGVLGVGGDPDPLRGEAGEPLRDLAADAGVALDRVVRETALRRERDRFETLFEGSTDAIAEVAFEPGQAVVRRVNPAFESTFGVEASAVVGRDIDEVVAPPGAEEAAREVTRVARDAGPVDREVTRRGSDDVREFHLRTVAFEGGDAGFAIYVDVTEHNRRTRALSRLHETARELVLSETDEEVAERAVRAAADVLGFPVNGVRLYDSSTDALELVAASSATSEVMGDRPTYHRGESIVWEVYERGEPRVVDDVSTVDDGVAREGIGSALYLPLGEHGVISMGAPEPNGFDESDVRLGGILAANVEVALDRARRTSLLRRREAELARQNERLEEFASVVSHDLRNPLAVAQGYLDMAKAAAGEETAEEFERVERAHGRIDRLITDLLTLAREGQRVGETTTVSLGEVAREAWRTVDTDGATLRVASDRELAADRDRLASLFENLFRNSVEHGSTSSRSETGDSVEHGSTGSRSGGDAGGADDATGSSSGSDDGDGAGSGVEVVVGALPDGDGFYVEDDGPGIPPEHREQVFERGYSTTREGTGFGLSIVEEIATAHGWTVEATEADGGGARFEITGVDAGGDA
jgi:PAS domain S-box-containing protein